jgi:hypothetical protein
VTIKYGFLLIVFGKVVDPIARSKATLKVIVAKFLGLESVTAVPAFKKIKLDILAASVVCLIPPDNLPVPVTMLILLLELVALKLLMVHGNTISTSEAGLMTPEIITWTLVPVPVDKLLVNLMFKTPSSSKIQLSLTPP